MTTWKKKLAALTGAFALLVLGLEISSNKAQAVVLTPSNTFSYTCSGSVTAFNVPFPFLQAPDLVVTIITTSTGVTARTLVLGTDYTLFPSSTATTATVTLASAGTCATGQSLVLTRTVALTQPQSFITQGQFFPAAHEQAYDREVMQIQQVQTNLAAGVQATSLAPGTIKTAGGITGDGTAATPLTTAVIAGNGTYDIDFSTLPSQNFKAGGDGNYTIDSRTWTLTGSTNVTNFQLVNGSGIQLGPILNSNLAKLTTTFNGLIAGATTDTSNFEVWFYITQMSVGTGAAGTWNNNAWAAVGITGYDGSTTPNTWYYFLGLKAYGASNIASQWDVNYNGTDNPQQPSITGSSPGPLLTDNVYVFRWSPDRRSCAIFTGVYSGGWPTVGNLNYRVWLYAANSGSNYIPGVGTPATQPAYLANPLTTGPFMAVLNAAGASQTIKRMLVIARTN